MDQSINVLLAIDKAYIVPLRALDCGPGLGGLNQVYGPNRPTHAYTICDKYNIFTRCAISNQLNILHMLSMLERGKHTCHTRVSTIHSVNTVWDTKFVLLIPVIQPNQN